MFGEKELERWNGHTMSCGLSVGVPGERLGWAQRGGFFCFSHPSPLWRRVFFFPGGLTKECDRCCFLSRRHDQSVTRLVKSTGISERDESPEPFILLLAHTALPSLSSFTALIAASWKSFRTFISRKGMVELLNPTWSVFFRFLLGRAE